MALTKAQEEQVVAHINKVWKSPECPLCGANAWSTHGVVNLMLADSGGIPFVIGQQPHLPTVAAVCTNCGNTVLINFKVATERRTT